MRLRADVVAFMVVLALLPPTVHAAPKPGTFLVGTARVSIAPTFPYKDGTIYVGGVIPGPLRAADGNASPTYTRAVAISGATRGSGVVLAEIDIQGAFAAVKQGPYGLDDVQKTVAPKLGLKPSQIIIGSSHTHAGADIMGLWGGSPSSYIKFVHDQTAKAIVRAWAARRPADLSWASTHALDMLENQSKWQGMDDEMRLLVATDAKTNKPIAMMPNWQGHPSVVPGNELHPDWVGVLDGMFEKRHPGAFAMAFVGAVGHTQTGQEGNTDEAVGIAKTTAYAAKMQRRLEAAYASHPHVVGAGPVETAQVFYKEFVDNPNPLILEYGNLDGAVDIYRSDQPPWLSDGNVVGMRAWVVRIGDIVLGATPGESYSIIHFWLRDYVHKELFFMGLAGDTLGYLAAPSEDIPKYATDVNDNLVVHVSLTVGDHTGCALLTAAKAIGAGHGKTLDRCAQWAGDKAVVAGG